MNTEIEAKRLAYQFDKFRLDATDFRLFNGGNPVLLEPKALQLLLFLLENPGRLLKKQQLLDAVWGDLSVSENALTREIALLRRALGDDSRQPRFIETVPTQGYRFIAPVRSSIADQESHHSSQAVAKTTESEISVSSDHYFRAIIVLVLIAGAISVAAFLIHNARTAPPNTFSRLVQVTFSSGLDIFPAFSPDGNSIAYSSDNSGKLEIYVRQLTVGGKEIQITSDGQTNVEPTYSPDGQWIAYHSKVKNGIWIVPALGGPVRRLTDFGSRPAWSHDGSRIAFESGDIGAFIETEVGSSPDSSIWTAKVSDGSLHQVTGISDATNQCTFSHKMFGHSSPQWSPDDRRLLFAVSGILCTASADGGDPRQVSPALFGYDPVYASDGMILFIGGSAAQSGIWKLHVNQAGVADGAPRLIHNVPPGSTHYLAISPNGERIGFVMLSTRDNLYSVSLDHKGRAVGQPVPITRDTRLRKTNPGFSPNGKLVSFGVAQIGRPNQIWTSALDGGSAEQIPFPEPAGNPSWLSDSALGFWTFNNGAQLWKWNIADARATQMFRTANSAMDFIRVSPDGSAAAFQRGYSGTTNVWTVSLISGRERQITFDKGLAGWPAWSRDGKMLAIEIKNGADTNIAVVPSNGGPMVPISHDSGQDWPYSWSPSGEQIAFAGFRNGVWNVFSVSRVTGEQKQLTGYAASNSFVRYPEWSPNGRRIAFEYGESTGNIWMLESR